MPVFRNSAPRVFHLALIETTPEAVDKAFAWGARKADKAFYARACAEREEEGIQPFIGAIVSPGQSCELTPAQALIAAHQYGGCVECELARGGVAIEDCGGLFGGGKRVKRG